MKSKKLENFTIEDKKNKIDNAHRVQKTKVSSSFVNQTGLSFGQTAKQSKKMSEPIPDDQIIGGYFNLGRMTSKEADQYTKAKQKANAAKAKKDKEQRMKAYNPFAGFDDQINFVADEDDG